MPSNRIGRKTAHGFADPGAPASAAPDTLAPPRDQRGDAAPAAPPPAREPRPRVSHDPGRASFGERPRPTPMVEVEVSHERGSAPRVESSKRTYEVWTNNHVYTLDPRLLCVEVRKTGTTSVVHDHPFIGARLVGGQLQDDTSVEMSYPLPRPGSVAVFEARRNNRRQFSRTSVVTRVVLRLRIVTVTDPTAVPTWEQVSSAED